ncbi:acyltransferase [Bowmanella sp. Y26]|uniref:acyltransferase n=1 Tax=Bowmanella yangjiangensis TaxID=2811230 RepID=UPI001BDD1C2B|nr:acyltransferase [Bowmanella yangjiangensis]MBT1066184.1 acyltransferase [Bowmanella yangjiangensis]
MLSMLPGLLLLPFHALLQIFNLMGWGSLIILLGIIKLISPVQSLTHLLNRLLNAALRGFAICGVWLINLFNRVEWDYEIEGNLRQDGWYLVMANHISWLDIILLMHFSCGRIPATKFFIKQELIWMPFIGLGAWALDMPFMRRYNAEFIAKYPHLKGKDLEATRKSCEKFSTIPTTVINFVEGTRFTEQKHRTKASPYTHLLSPKAGGVAFTLASMGNLFDDIIDVTLIYPHNSKHVMMDMLCGRLTKVVLRAKAIPLARQLVGNYQEDDIFRAQFQGWLNQLWQDKDSLIQQLRDDS